MDVLSCIIYGYSGEPRLEDSVQSIFPRLVDLDGSDIYTRHHHFARLPLAEREDTLEHILLLAILDVGYLERLLESIGRDILILLGNHTVYDKSRLHHKAGEG